MEESIPPEEQSNYETFRDCLSEPVLKALAAPVQKTKKKKKAGRKTLKNGVAPSEPDQTVEKPHSTLETANDAEVLGDFIDYLSRDIFPSLPPDLRTLTHSTFKSTPHLQDTYSPPLTLSTTEPLLSTLPPSALDSLSSYSLLPPHPADLDPHDLHNFFAPILTSYINSVTAPPPIWSSTRTTECELCERDWVPLTYHHLIPRSMHDRVRKRGWHDEERLGSVAWLCRACHSFVHRVATNEELAREYWSVELLEEREDVQGWVKWVSKVRWKKR